MRHPKGLLCVNPPRTLGRRPDVMCCKDSVFCPIGHGETSRGVRTPISRTLAEFDSPEPKTGTVIAGETPTAEHERLPGECGTWRVGFRTYFGPEADNASMFYPPWAAFIPPSILGAIHPTSAPSVGLFGAHAREYIFSGARPPASPVSQDERLSPALISAARHKGLIQVYMWIHRKVRRV